MGAEEIVFEKSNLVYVKNKSINPSVMDGVLVLFELSICALVSF